VEDGGQQEPTTRCHSSLHILGNHFLTGRSRSKILFLEWATAQLLFPN
jgi:hypothetical protein